MKGNSNNNTKKFYVVSLSYTKANTEIRGKFTFFSESVESFAKAINTYLNGTKMFVLSTCNRTELYTQTDNIEKVIELYCQHISASSEEFKNYISIFEGSRALTHFLRVSSGLESQILGDFEIIYQIKTWFTRFKKHKTTDAFLERLVNIGIQTSKKVKSSTSLSNGATSVSYASVNYILKKHSNLSHKKIALIGTGKIGRNTCENLSKHIKNPQITLLNRSLSTAKEISDKMELKYEDFSQLHRVINQSDIVIVATSASEPIINKNDITSQQPLTLIDLSVPANIAPEVRELENVTLLNIDELSQTINETFQLRAKEIPKAEKIIAEMLEEFNIWEQHRKYVPIIQAFKSDLERIKEYQVKTLKKEQKEISETGEILSDKIVQKITNRLANYLIENPEKAEATIGLFQEMFQLQVVKS